MGKRVAVQRQKTAGLGKPSAKPGLRLQRKCACGAAPGTCGCDEHDKRKVPIRRRASTPAAPDVVPEAVHEVLRAQGRPLEEDVRAFMESRLGHDFTHVRVHTDARAAESARAVGALAYTVGKDVVFASGQYRPETREGRSLLAHELAHVTQQGDGGRFDGRLEVGPSDSPEERAADEAALSVEADAAVEVSPVVPSPATMTQSASPVLRRKTGDTASWFRGLFSSLILGTFGFPDSWLQAYLEQLDRTGDIEGDPDSDDKAREIINTWRKGGSQFVLTERRKALLIHELLDGPTTGGDEDAILELLVRSFNYELSYIFGPGGVTAARLVEDIPDDPGDRLFEFFVDRCEGGHEAALAGKFKPKGAPPVPLGLELPPVGETFSNVQRFKGGSSGWDVQCVLGLLCSEDQAVVAQLPSLDVKRMERIDVKSWKFDGKSWSSETVHPVGVNKPDKKLVGIVKSTDCNSAAQTFYHEVRHQNQTEDLRKTHFTMEVDAYTETEKWAIARGLPEPNPGESLRSTDRNSGVQSPSAKAIEEKVTRIYGKPTDEDKGDIKRHEGTETIFEKDGKEDRQPSKAGEHYLEEPPTFVGEEPFAPKEWKCPEQKPGPLIQRKCGCGGEAGTAGECEECARKRAPGLQAKLNVSEPGDRFEAEADLLAERITRIPDQLEHDDAPGLQRQAVTSVGHMQGELNEAPPAVQEVLRSPGSPLDAQTRGFMESRFGHDFSHVRVHTDARAHTSARAVDALSYTVGRNVVFAEGQYAPATGKGRRLLAHELTHVLQQGGGGRPALPVQRQTGGALLQRQPDDAKKKKYVILSLNEIKADESRKKRLERTAQNKARTCKSTSKFDNDNCPDSLEPGTEVTYVGEPVKGAWMQIEQPRTLKMFGPKEPVYILSVFAKEKPPPAPPKPKPAPSTPAPASPEGDALSEPPESPLLARIKKRRDGLSSKVRWTPPKSSPQVGRTRVAIDLLTVAKDFYFNEPTDRETADAILAKVKKNFSEAYLTDSNFDKKFRDLSGLTRTDTHMLLQAGRGSLDTLIGKIKSGQVQPGNAGGEATFQYHLTAFISAHEVMEVLAGDLDLKEAKNIQTLEVAASGKGIIAFAEGVLSGLKSKLSDEDYKTISKKMLVSGIPVLGQSVFLAGTTVGIGKDIYEALKGLYELVTNPGEMITNMASLIGTLITDEEAARAMGFVLGEEKSKEIKAMVGEDIVTFTYQLGKLIGPTIVYAILWLTGIGEAMTAAAVERMGMALKRFPKVISALEKIEKGLAKVKAALPKRKAVKAAEEAEQLAAGAGKAAKKVEGAGKVAKEAEEAAQAGKVAKGAEHAAEDVGAAAKDARKAAAAESGVAAEAKAEGEAGAAGSKAKSVLAEERFEGHEYKILEDGTIIRCSNHCGPLRNRLKNFKKAHPNAEGLADLEKDLKDIEAITDPKKKAREAAKFDKRLKQNMAKYEPGEWLDDFSVQNMSEDAKKYQARAMKAKPGTGYYVNNVQFDGFENGVLLDAKYYLDDGRFMRDQGYQFKKAWEILDDAKRQLKAAGTTPIEWRVAGKQPAKMIEALFKTHNINIKVVFFP